MSNAAMSLAVDRLSKALDPKAGILAEIGADTIADYQLFDDDLLLGTYIRPERTKGGIWLTDKAKDEDRYQGKAGLLIKAGPAAWKYDVSGQYPFEGEVPALHSWLVYRASEGWEISLNGVSCRIIRARHIRGVISDPSVIW